jgi:hypothetical protein
MNVASLLRCVRVLEVLRKKSSRSQSNSESVNQLVAATGPEALRQRFVIIRVR